MACLIAAVCRNGSSHGQGGSRLHHRRPNWLLPQPNGLLIPPDRGSSPLFRVCPAGSWEQLSFPRVLINPAPPCISYNKQSKLNRLVYEDSRQLGWVEEEVGHLLDILHSQLVTTVGEEVGTCPIECFATCSFSVGTRPGHLRPDLGRHANEQLQFEVRRYDSFSDVGEIRVYFASKILTPCRMH